MKTWVGGRRQGLTVLGDSVPSKMDKYHSPGEFGKRNAASVADEHCGSHMREESFATA